MATSDMSLGGGAGFGAGYTPIRFAPLVSLTGPVMAPATPAAPEAAAPMLRLPMMADQGGGYETPQRTDAAFENLQPIGDRLETPEGRAAEFQNLSRAMTALMSPMTTIPSLALTGKTPMELMAQAMGMGGGQAVQGTPAAPFGGFLQGLQNLRDSFARNVFGPEEVPLFETRAPLEQATPVSAGDIQLQDLASSLGISLPEAAAILGGQAATAPAGPAVYAWHGYVWAAERKLFLRQRFWWNFWSNRRVWFLWVCCGCKRRPSAVLRQPASLQWPRWSINEH
jgi:hypothetical protein